MVTHVNAWKALSFISSCALTAMKTVLGVRVPRIMSVLIAGTDVNLIMAHVSA